jgi:hypothetical protein
MHIALIYIAENKNFIDNAKTFSNELLNKNHIVKFINGKTEKGRLGGNSYLIFFVESEPFFGKIYLEQLTAYLKEAGNITAKYACVFTNKGLMSERKLLKYMKKLEGEGLIIHESKVIYDKNHAVEIARSIEPVK